MFILESSNAPNSRQFRGHKPSQSVATFFRRNLFHRPFAPLPSVLLIFAIYLRIGRPSLTAGGLVLSDIRDGFFTSTSSISISSTLVSRFKKLLSFTGLPLVATPPLPNCILMLPEPPVGPPIPGDDKCGIFSGRGC